MIKERHPDSVLYRDMKVSSFGVRSYYNICMHTILCRGVWCVCVCVCVCVCERERERLAIPLRSLGN